MESRQLKTSTGSNKFHSSECLPKSYVIEDYSGDEGNP
uniref:Uncharacterized protein n=1 Tax=Peronospora matthiolae TaxID=2874970 RepID=A0AAV1U0B3_9STRA